MIHIKCQFYHQKQTHKKGAKLLSILINTFSLAFSITYFKTYTYWLNILKFDLGSLLGRRFFDGVPTLTVHRPSPGAGQRQGGTWGTVILWKLTGFQSLPEH